MLLPLLLLLLQKRAAKLRGVQPCLAAQPDSACRPVLRR
jgi:hypothetical protein